MSNVHGLFGGKKNDDEDDDAESNRRYVGGVSARGGGSGLAVEPNNDGGSDSNTPASERERDTVFNLAESVGGGGATDSAGSEEEMRRTITMYRNGFVVDEGEYRRLDDPANAEFLRSMARGITPRELLTNADGTSGDVSVRLVDKRSEEYEESFKSFSGAGNSLRASEAAEGSNDSGVDLTVLDPANLSSVAAAASGGEGAQTSIQVRTTNNQRRVIRIETTATVRDLAIRIVGEVSQTQPFRLLAGFPPKPIQDFSKTVEEAGLKGSSVSMKNA